MRSLVYPDPEYVESLATATPVADHVAVDAELRGCPISPDQLREFVTATLARRRPNLPDEAVCAECKRRNVVCVAVAEGVTCLGPVTRSGCGALCPAYGRGCYGCFGPRESANGEGLATWLGRDRDAADTARSFALFNAWSPPFRRVIDAAGGPPGPIDGRLTDESRRRIERELDLEEETLASMGSQLP